MENKNDRCIKAMAILVYSFIAIAIRYYFVIYKPHFLYSIRESLVYGFLTGVGPLIASLFVLGVFKRKMIYSIFGSSRRKTLFSLLVPICLFFIYDIITQDNKFSNTIVVSVCLIYGFCEEFGWRGYLQSELIHLSTIRRALIITTIWFIWHLNFSLDINNFIFFLVLFGGSLGIGKIAIKTNSILLCGCFHAVINIVTNLEINLIKICLLIISVVLWFFIWNIRLVSKRQ